MSQVGTKFSGLSESIFKQLEKINDDAKAMQASTQQSTGNQSNKTDFAEYLKDSVQAVNTRHKIADRMASELATGRSENIHETMLAASQAELSFNLMVQLRNKALEAYGEILRMPV